MFEDFNVSPKKSTVCDNKILTWHFLASSSGVTAGSWFLLLLELLPPLLLLDLLLLLLLLLSFLFPLLLLLFLLPLLPLVLEEEDD